MVAAGEPIATETLALPLALSGGRTATLGDFAGRWLVLYFYPKDSTPGCTTEGLDFDARLPAFEALGCAVLGASRDSVRAHDNFRAKQGFRFPLVSDPGEVLCRAFDVIREKTLYGRRYLGVERSTFLLSPESRLVREWRSVRVPGHAQAVLDALSSAQAP